MMTRVLAVSLLAATLIRPAAGIAASTHNQAAVAPHVLDTIGEGGMNAARDFWVHHERLFSNLRLRPVTDSHALRNGAGNVPGCSQEVALAPEARCVGACDAAKESCDRQCTAGRSSCMAQCPALGFMCDSSCQAAYFICKGKCGRAHDSCKLNCGATGGERN